jgi:hypothetical protein
LGNGTAASTPITTPGDHLPHLPPTLLLRLLVLNYWERFLDPKTKENSNNPTTMVRNYAFKTIIPCKSQAAQLRDRDRRRSSVLQSSSSSWWLPPSFPPRRSESLQFLGFQEGTRAARRGLVGR